MRSFKANALFKFDKPFRGFYIFLVLALLSRVVIDFVDLQRFEIHAGEKFPYRHVLASIPVYSVTVLMLEWGLIVAGALAIAWGKVRWGAALATVGLLMSLSQMFQNQKMLLFIVTAVLVVQPVSQQKRDSIWYLKAQLCLVYLFTALNKLFDDFSSGQVLQSLLHPWIAGTSFDNLAILKPLAWAAIAVQLVIPLLLLKKPQWGLWLVVGFHCGLALGLKDIWPFTWTMIALSLLFLLKPVQQGGDLDRNLARQVS